MRVLLEAMFCAVIGMTEVPSYSIDVPASPPPGTLGHELSTLVDQQLLDEILDIETVTIEGGSFTMGTPIQNTRHPEYHADEAPVAVVVEDFRIGKFPVTAAQMCVFLNDAKRRSVDTTRYYNHKPLGNGAYHYTTITLSSNGLYVPMPNAARAPANQVTWIGAVRFCEWLSEESGKSYRLPSEAEWELAARGLEGRKWPWGDADPDITYGLRFNDGLAGRLSWPKIPVGSYSVNATPDGVFDMLGYLTGDWCANKWVDNPTPEEAVDTKVDIEDVETRRVVRGYYHRLENRKRSNFLSWFFLPEVGKHPGRPWTRVGCPPLFAVEQAARHGFRVVLETPRVP